LRIITAVAVGTTASIDLTTLVVNAALAIIAVPIILTTALRTIALTASRVFIAAHVVRTSIASTTSHALFVHQPTHFTLFIHGHTFRKFGAISIRATLIQTHLAHAHIHAGHVLGAYGATVAAFTQAYALHAQRTFGAITIRTTARKGVFTSPFNADLGGCAIIRRLATLRPPSIATAARITPTDTGITAR
jgi:hypothetical protein